MSKVVGQRSWQNNTGEGVSDVTCCQAAEWAIAAWKRKAEAAASFVQAFQMRESFITYSITDSPWWDGVARYCPICGDKMKGAQ